LEIKQYPAQGDLESNLKYFQGWQSGSSGRVLSSNPSITKKKKILKKSYKMLNIIHYQGIANLKK
jgi:hypothetical protein